MTVPRRVALLALLGAMACAALPHVAQARDQVVVTGGLTVPRGAVVDDAIVIDGPVRIAGRATGDVVAVAGDARISGRVDGDLTTVAGRATLLPGSSVGGDVRYGDERPVVARGARVGGQVTDEGWRNVDRGFGVVGWLALWLAFSVSALVLGLILLGFAPRAADAALRAVREATWPAVGWGVALLVGLPLVAVAALVTLVGIPFGVALLLALVPLLAVGYVAGAWLLGRVVVKPPTGRVLAFLAGLAILRAIALVPVLGGIAWIVATVMGLGSLVVAGWRAGHQPRAAAPPPPVPASGSGAR